MTGIRRASAARISFLRLRGVENGSACTTASPTTSAASAGLSPASIRRSSAASAAIGRVTVGVSATGGGGGATGSGSGSGAGAASRIADTFGCGP